MRRTRPGATTIPQGVGQNAVTTVAVAANRESGAVGSHVQEPLRW